MRMLQEGAEEELKMETITQTDLDAINFAQKHYFKFKGFLSQQKIQANTIFKAMHAIKNGKTPITTTIENCLNTVYNFIEQY